MNYGILRLQVINEPIIVGFTEDGITFPIKITYKMRASAIDMGF